MKPIADLPFAGGHVALDFVNTAEGRDGPGAGDALGRAADLAVWGQRYGLLDTPGGGGGVGTGAGTLTEPAGSQAAEGELAQAADARELLYSLFLDRVRGESSPADALSRLARIAAESYRAGHLRADGNGNVRWAWPSEELATARHVVVTSALDLLRDVPAGRLKQCPGDNCGWFFLDTTKRGNRRWCSMSECGQDAKDERRRALRREGVSLGSVGVTTLPFRQVDVFTDSPLLGNPVAVVHDADGLTDKQMQDFARWTNLSETTFLLAPRDSKADYRVRIFTTSQELPFAGHPTLGTCHAWLESGGRARNTDAVIQECGAGLVPVRRDGDGRLAFGAPPLIRSGPVEPAIVDRIASVLKISRDEIVDAQWVDNGPGWVAALLASAEAVLKLSPAGDLSGESGSIGLGVVGSYPDGSPEEFEVRAFFPMGGITVEDPVTGSLNASLAQWLLGTGRATAPYIVSQGTAIGRQGRVHVSVSEPGSGDSGIWVGGGTITLITGTVSL